jgi:clan AA aspartic protease
VKGRLTPDYTAYVELEVIEAGGTRELVVDTGFNDYLYLPEDAIAAWNLPFVVSATVSLADGSTMIADLYEANLVWFGATVRVPVLAGPPLCDSLVGMKLLAGCRIELDERNAEVRIEQL